MKTYNGFDSKYYVRKLKKIKKLVDGVEKELSSERYKLAFANTIYDDDTTQITFTDDIDVGGLTDNLGRPITELFVTIVKSNRGLEKASFYKFPYHKIWRKIWLIVQNVVKK